MFRTSDIILIAAMVAVTGYTYLSKHQAEVKQAEIRKTEIAIRQEKETIDLLKAEWSFLSQPMRLQKLAEEFAAELELKTLEAKAVTEASAVPEKSMDAESLIKEDMAAAKDQTVTGGVKP